MEKKLREIEIKQMQVKVVEGRIEVEQLCFHNTNRVMIEICGRDSLQAVQLAGEMARLRSLANLQMLLTQINQVVQQQCVSVPVNSGINGLKCRIGSYRDSCRCLVR